MNPIRALHVLGATDRGGIETWLVRLLPHLDPQRVRIDVAVHDSTPGAYDLTLRELGVGIHPCPYPQRPWSYAPAFKRILAEHGPFQVLHGQQYLFNGALMRWGHAAGVPVRIAHQHPLTDIRSASPGRWLYRRLMTHWTAKHATCLLYPSAASRDSFAALGMPSALPSRIMPNCIDLARFAAKVDAAAVRQRLGLPTDKPLVAYVARFAAHKNQALAFAVADECQRHGLAVHVALAGSHGELLEPVRRRAAERNDVSVFTDLTDISDLLLSSDAFLFPSLEEGFGVVAVEAQAAGLPVVATALPSIAEALCPELRRFQFPANDAVRAALHLREILDDRALHDTLARAGRDWAQRFSISSAATALTTCYEELCAASAQAGR